MIKSPQRHDKRRTRQPCSSSSALGPAFALSASRMARPRSVKGIVRCFRFLGIHPIPAEHPDALLLLDAESDPVLTLVQGMR